MAELRFLRSMKVTVVFRALCTLLVVLFLTIQASHLGQTFLINYFNVRTTYFYMSKSAEMVNAVTHLLDIIQSTSMLPDTLYSNRTIGRAELYADNPLQAIQYLEQAHQQGNNDWLTFFYLAEAYEAVGNQSKANTAWQKSGAAQYLVYQAKKFITDGDIEIGLERLRLAAQIAPQNMEVLYAAGDSYWSRGGNLDEAIQYYLRAIDLDETSNFRKHFAAGRIYHVTGEWDLAIHEFEEASIFSDRLGAPYYWLGMAWRYGKKDVAKASEVFEKCIVVQPDFPVCYLELAKIYEDQGRTEEAARMLEMGK